jgi:CheY-like chemotaxis protein
MRVLLVENDADVIEVLEDAARSAPHEIEVFVARSKSAGLHLLESLRVELAIFDLQIPTADGALDEDVAHGMAVFRASGRLLPGTPRIVWSGRATNREYEQIIEAKTQGDPYGLDEPSPMLEFFNKDDLRSCARRVTAIAAHREAIADIRISPEQHPVKLSGDEMAVLRLHARRVGGNLVRIAEIGGGLSGARAFRSRVLTAEGQLVSRVLAKVGPTETTRDERSRFRKYVTSVLDGGNFASFAGEVTEGAGPVGGLFYGLLEEFETTVFGLVATDDAAAARMVTEVCSATVNWHGEGIQGRYRFADVRAPVLSDERQARVQGKTVIDLGVLDQQWLYANAATQHGDLHGENVLVAADGRPVLIDFARTGPAFSALDPVTLELSILFHPDSPFRNAAWPRAGQALRWAFVDEYLDGCPVPLYVQACRAWAFQCAAEAREVYAHVAGFALRQLDFPDIPEDWAHELSRGAADLLMD